MKHVRMNEIYIHTYIKYGPERIKYTAQYFEDNIVTIQTLPAKDKVNGPTSFDSMFRYPFIYVHR
jgi:hypothetical protein